MNTSRLFLSAALAAAGLAIAAPLTPDTPLIEDKGVKVTVLDFEATMSRVPEERRAEVRSSHERIANLIDTTYISRHLAVKARALGMDKDPVVQKRMEQAQEAVLTELYMQRVEREYKFPDLEKRARELYAIDRDKFRTEDHIHLQHILVGLTGRTREMALQRAKELRAELEAGKEDFLAMAQRVSDDPEKRKNGGDLGWFSPKSIEAPIIAAVANFKKGEVSQPIETRHGYHIVKYIDRKAGELKPYEAVRPNLIAGERERLIKDARDEELRKIRDSSTVIVYKANLDALRVDIDVSKAARDASAAMKAARPQ